MNSPSPPQVNPSISMPLPLQASKWLKIQFLIDSSEMEALFATLQPFYLYNTSSIIPKDELRIPHERFLNAYKHYVDKLKQGEVDPSPITLFSSVLSLSDDHLYAMEVGEQQQILRVCKPVLQMQAHKLDYSTVDGKFYSMTFGQESISWGLQISYPQLYEEPTTKEIIKTLSSPHCPNTPLFHNFQRWVRQHTIPTPFIVNEKKINLPVRLGKECLPWINRHPQLIKKKIEVDASITTTH